MNKMTSNFSELFLGLIAGGAFGAAAGFLFAPKSGKELRSDIKEKGTRIYEDTQRMLSDVEMKSRSTFEEARYKAEDLKKKADRRLTETRFKACRALGCGEETRAQA